MKKIKHSCRFLIIFALSVFVLSACESKDDKISSLIKGRVKETLSNPDSYQPVETIIDSLKNDRYGDTLILDNSLKSIEARRKFTNAEKMFYEKRDIVNDYLNSTTATNKDMDAINNEKQKMDEYLKDMDTQGAIIKSLETEIKAYDKKCDGKFYGWLVTHKFNYVSKDGEPSSGTYILFVDKDYRKVYRVLDEDKNRYDGVKLYLDGLMKGLIK